MASLVLPGVERVASAAQLVSINKQGVLKVAKDIASSRLAQITTPYAFDSDTHFAGPSPLLAQYLLVVDTLNFCFWPEPGLEYENLARGLKTHVQMQASLVSMPVMSSLAQAASAVQPPLHQAVVTQDAEALSAARLAQADGPTIQRFFDWPKPVPLQDLRAGLVREVGEVLQRSFQGSAERLIRAADGSALRLVELVTSSFPGFRDETQYRGGTVRLYKRAQIFVGDVWGAFQGKGLGAFQDIDQLTMFADYRVPVVLRELGILEYAPELAAKVLAKQELPAGSPEEVEIRACTIVAVERLKHALAALLPAGTAVPTSLQLDWWLWEEGERNRHAHPPHHRTVTTFY